MYRCHECHYPCTAVEQIEYIDQSRQNIAHIHKHFFCLNNKHASKMQIKIGSFLSLLLIGLVAAEEELKIEKLHEVPDCGM